MYKIEKDKLKAVLIQALIILFSCFFGVLAYIVYLDGQIYSYEKTAIGTKLLKQVTTNEDGDVKNNGINSAMQSVVGISKLQDNGTSIFLEKSTENLGLGTGVIVSSNGYILTNQHVVGDKYSNCYVTLDNGIQYQGSVVWADEEIDLAIVKIGVTDLKCIEFTDSNDIYVGEKVYAIGNPVGFEFQKTVTSGIISGKDRTVKIKNDDNSYSYMESLIQTDATINEGNSGGPLINENGEILGITSVKVNDAEGIGFAIPINIVKPIIEKFEVEGKFTEAYLGIYGYDKEVIPYLKDSIDFEDGIYIADINKRSNLRNANLKVGDIITKIDEQNLERMSELREYIYKKTPGDVVILTIKRNNKEYTLKVRLGEKL